MPDFRPAPSALVLYKIRPALVVTVGEKIEIELEGGARKKVRPKDISLIHPGPITNLNQLQEPSGDFEEAWELLADETASLEDFSELVFGEYSPASAWFAWQLVTDGLHFDGTPEEISARPKEAVEADLAARNAKQAAETARPDLLARLERKQLEASDHKQLAEVERVALGTTDKSKILKALGYPESAPSAHRMLTKVGYWLPHHNPYPARHALATEDPEIPLPELDGIERLDLTHLPAYAIDDEGSNDPDDALSLDGDRIWVHVADVSGLVSPDSELDEEARARGANLYIPERIVHMLPPDLTTRLALGLHDESPALSIGFRVGEDGLPSDVKLALTRVKVTRHTYGEIDQCLGQSPFLELKRLTDLFQASRQAADAVSIDLPEVSVRVQGGEVVIKPLERLAGRW